MIIYISQLQAKHACTGRCQQQRFKIRVPACSLGPTHSHFQSLQDKARTSDGTEMAVESELLLSVSAAVGQLEAALQTAALPSLVQSQHLQHSTKLITAAKLMPLTLQLIPISTCSWIFIAM